MAWRWDKANGNFGRLNLRNAFGPDCIVCCPGPSLADAAGSLASDIPGAWKLAINTAYPSVRPDVWIGMDPPECYAADLPWQPFLKFWGAKYAESEFRGRLLKESPGTIFLKKRADNGQDMPGNAFVPKRLGDDFRVCWVGWTFFAAMHLAAWLGARRLWLIGADFGGLPGDYHDGRKLDDHLSKRNHQAMEIQLAIVPQMLAKAEKYGYAILSMSKHSRLNEWVPYMPLKDAVARIGEEIPGGQDHERLHAYIAANSAWRPVGKLVAERGVLTGADRKTEWMLPWWYENLRRHNPDIPVAFGDFGLSESMAKWCAARGTMVDCKQTELAGWFCKPSAICFSPFRDTLWLDSDCEVLGDVTPAFDALDRAESGFCADLDPHNPAAGYRGVSTGVVAVRHRCELVTRWARTLLANPNAYRGDQEVLSVLVDTDNPLVGVLPSGFERLRIDGGPLPETVVMHWTGPQGKRVIREKMRANGVGVRHEDVLGSLIREHFNGDEIRGAEIGVLAGALSASLLRRHPKLRLWMVDAWKDAADSRESALSSTAFASERRTVLEGDSVGVAARMQDGLLDFVFIDADHGYSGCRADIEAWYPKVRAGGLVAGHDIDHPDHPEWGVRQAVEAFMAATCPAAKLHTGPHFTWWFNKVEAD